MFFYTPSFDFFLSAFCFPASSFIQKCFLLFYSTSNTVDGLSTARTRLEKKDGEYTHRFLKSMTHCYGNAIQKKVERGQVIYIIEG